LWAEIEPRHYERSVEAVQLIRSFLGAFVMLLPSLEALVRRFGQTLATSHASTLSYALRRASSLAMVKVLIARLEEGFHPGELALVALDSMAASLRKTQRHGCKAMTRTAVGGGVLWAFCVDAVRGACPVKMLKFTHGAWSDSKTLMGIDLVSRGPVYLMDRGFWAIALIGRLLKNQTRFIMRASRQDFTFEIVQTLGLARMARRGVRIEIDAIVTLGSKQRKMRPRVRLVYARTKKGKDLILVSDRMQWSAERILESYRQRWQIERFHRFLKESVGLAHLYNFQQRGLEFLVHVALLLALLLFLSDSRGKGLTADILYSLLKNLRLEIGLLGVWRRNTPRWRKRTSKGNRKGDKTIE